MKLNASTQYFIVGKGWKCGPMYHWNKHAVLTRVIAMLEWGARTKGNRP